MLSNAEAWQDTFAHLISQQTQRTSYIEIGAAFPKQSNTTYVLDACLGWKGFSLELNTQYEPQWATCTERGNPCYFQDAITFDYVDALRTHNLPNRLGYLSCDIDPPSQTFKALTTLIDQGLQFDTICFEHDRYCSDQDYHAMSESYLIPHGYKLAVSDVHPIQMPGCYFETWYVKDDIQFTPMNFVDFMHTYQGKFVI